MDLEIVRNSQVSKTNATEDEIEFLTMSIGKQKFGISVENIRDVIAQTEVAKVPLVPEEVIGLINLRGRIVTAIDIRAILDIQSDYDLKNNMSVVVDYRNELYSLVVDSIGEVVTLPLSHLKHNPENMEKKWVDIAIGIYPVEDELIVIVDINKLLKSLYER